MDPWQLEAQYAHSHRLEHRIALKTHPHTGELAVRSRTFPRLSDSEEEKREEVEDVREGRVQPVVVGGVIVADFVQMRHWRRQIGDSSDARNMRQAARQRSFPSVQRAVRPGGVVRA